VESNRSMVSSGLLTMEVSEKYIFPYTSTRILNCVLWWQQS
jgi:hypothetical protein